MLFKQGQQNVGNCWSALTNTWMVIILFKKSSQDVQNVFNVRKLVLEKKEYSITKVNTKYFESPVSLLGR